MDVTIKTTVETDEHPDALLEAAAPEPVAA
jgi:hypothetical protein